MKKKITSIILFILITLIATTIYAAITANANLIVSSSKVKPGEEFTITLNVKDIDAGSDGLMGAQFKINYDKNVLETLTEDSIKGLSGLADNYNESDKGNILIVSGFSGIKSDSDFVEVTFKVKENAELKDTTITFENIEVFNLEKTNIGSKSVTVEVVSENEEDKDDVTPTPTTKPTATPDGGSESTPTPSAKPGETKPTGAPTATAKPNSGENKNDVPVTNIDTNTSSGTGSSNSGSSSSTSGSSSSSSTIKGSTTSSSSLPKAGIGSTIAILTVAAVAIGTVAYIKLRKYREI